MGKGGFNARTTISTAAPRPLRPGEDPDIHWSQEAACLGADTELFYFDGTDNPARAHQLIDLYCSRCPVRAPCLKESDEYDRRYVLRGGQVPDKFFTPKEPGRPRRGSIPSEMCPRGHSEWTVRKVGSGRKRRYCLPCDRTKREAREAANIDKFERLSDAEKAAMLARVKRAASMTTCPSGHQDWKIILKRGKYCKVCHECDRVRDRRKRKGGSDRLAA